MTLTNFTQYELQKPTAFTHDLFQSFHTCVIDWLGGSAGCLCYWFPKFLAIVIL